MKRRQAFTLIELLAVMAIMILMSALVVGSYIGMTKGTAARSAVQHLRGILGEARQMAILRGRRTYVIFVQDDVPLPQNPYYVLCRHEGTATSGTAASSLTDAYHDLIGMAGQGGAELYNLDKLDQTPDNFMATVTGNTASDNSVQTSRAIWQIGNRYGWQLGVKHYLPRDFLFGEGGTPKRPDVVVFYPDGTVGNADGKLGSSVIVKAYELTNPNYVVGVKIEPIGTMQSVFGA